MLSRNQGSTFSKALTGCFVLIAGVLASTSPAAAADWVLLGERVVNDAVETDTIGVGIDRGEFTAIKLKVLRRPVRFVSVKVHFANGGVQDVELRSVVPAGGESRVVDLNGDDRRIEKIVLRYEAESLGRGARATVKVFGRR